MDAELLRIHPDEPEPEHIARVAQALDEGNVVALPTDTFYGLAVDPVNLRAVDRIYDLKNRARHKPLSLLISDVSQAYELARGIDAGFDRLAERFWPGPLTVIVRAGSKLPLRVTANTGNVALRVPEAPICRAIVEKLGLPITATSANLRGLPECTWAGCVREQLGDKIPLIVDGGPTSQNRGHHHRRPFRRGKLLDDPARGSHSHPRDRSGPATLATLSDTLAAALVPGL